LEQQLQIEPSPETQALLKVSVPAPAPKPIPLPLPTPRPLPAEEPAPRSSMPTQARLPLTLTRFFGREAEIAALTEWFRSGARLVTLTGSGGCGKTRLAIEVAQQLQKEYADHVWFVSLADLAEAQSIPNATASALGL